MTQRGGERGKKCVVGRWLCWLGWHDWKRRYQAYGDADGYPSEREFLQCRHCLRLRGYK